MLLNNMKIGNTQKNTGSWTFKLYKGLSTHTREETRKYLANIERHRVAFNLVDSDDDEAMSLVSLFACVEFNLIACSSIGFSKPTLS